MSEQAITWAKGWTPWGTPVSVRMDDGKIAESRATECSSNCPVARLAAKVLDFTSEDSSVTAE